MVRAVTLTHAARAPVHPSCARSRQVVQALVGAGANVNHADDGGQAALHQAYSGDVCRALIAAGATVDARDCDGKTPLHFRVRDSVDPGVLQALLDAGGQGG
jgi:ankyrin repeat protein